MTLVLMKTRQLARGTYTWKANEKKHPWSKGHKDPSYESKVITPQSSASSSGAQAI